MPPPPPPSASYLWNWKEEDSSSGSDVDDMIIDPHHGSTNDTAEELEFFLASQNPSPRPSRIRSSNHGTSSSSSSSSSTEDEKQGTRRASSSSSSSSSSSMKQESHKTTSTTNSTIMDNPDRRSHSSDTLTTSVERIQTEEQERFFQQQQQQQNNNNNKSDNDYDDNASNTLEEDDLRLLLSEEDEEEEETASSLCANNNNNNKRLSKAQRKRNQKKKGKKKNKTVTTTAAHIAGTITQIQQPLVETKQVSFGQVTVHWFERCLGLDVVPGDGGWPLGMGGERVARAEALSIHEYETEKQERLQVRWEHTIQQQQQQQHQQHDHKSNNRKEGQTGTNTSSATATISQAQNLTVTGPLETRQFDYRHGAKNPLFRMLTELERMNLLLAASSSSHTDDNEEHDATKHSLSSCGDQRRSTRRTRSRSGSFSENNNHSSAQQHSHRPRSNSHTSSFSNLERFNDHYPQPAVHHVRNELEQIRHARTKAGATGCTCRKLHVYLVPPDGGKKAHHRRLKLSKVKDELRKRHALPATQADNNNQSREELEQLLHDLVEAEPCCSSNNSDCPCARDGVGCQADACTCWHASHLTKQQQQHGSGDASSSSSSFVPSLVQQRCGNPHGMYVVDLDQINVVRRQVLTTMTLCAPVET